MCCRWGPPPADDAACGLAPPSSSTGRRCSIAEGKPPLLAPGSFAAIGRHVPAAEFPYSAAMHATSCGGSDAGLARVADLESALTLPYTMQGSCWRSRGRRRSRACTMASSPSRRRTTGSTSARAASPRSCARTSRRVRNTFSCGRTLPRVSQGTASRSANPLLHGSVHGSLRPTQRQAMRGCCMCVQPRRQASLVTA